MKLQIVLPVRSDPDFNLKRLMWIDAARAIGHEIVMPDGTPPGAFDLESALKVLNTVQLVVADLAFERPSCYYELGLAQALGVPAVLLNYAKSAKHQHAPVVAEYLYEDLSDYGGVVKQVLSALPRS